MTAHRNPFAIPVVVSGVMIVLLSLLLVPVLGVWGLILVPGVVQICFNNWWIVLVGLRSMGSNFRSYVRGLFGIPTARSRSLLGWIWSQIPVRGSHAPRTFFALNDDAGSALVG